jgi:hypothetical protein
MKPINIIHILVGILLLIWLNSKIFKPINSEIAKGIIILVGVSIMLYHLSKYRDTSAWIYLFHALIVAPVIIYFGLFQESGRRMLQLVAVTMISYHLAIISRIL